MESPSTADVVSPWQPSSLEDFHRDSEPPTRALKREYVSEGNGKVFLDRAAAERFLDDALPASLGNVHKAKRSGGSRIE